MVLLGGIEALEGSDGDGDRSVEAPRGGQGLARAEGELLLLVVVVEDLRPVLVAAVGELAFGVRRVDLAPEDLEQLFVAHLLGIEVDLDGLGVPVTPRQTDS